jgi:hypothetical protein
MAGSEKKSITPEFTRQLAELAGLRVDDSRAQALAVQMQALGDGIEAMDELDLGEAEPAMIAPGRG